MLLADSVGVALMVVLDTLAPAERLAFVLHDVFAVSFGEIGEIIDRSPPRPGSWPAGPGAGCGERPESPRPRGRRSGTSSRPSCPPPGTGLRRPDRHPRS
ncbi:hypothetical protein ACFQ0B_51185 [Nonomuraea thailandensis]